jgi:hypothetical protein
MKVRLGTHAVKAHRNRNETISWNGEGNELIPVGGGVAMEGRGQRTFYERRGPMQ